jgi:hypothetical protein
MVVRQVVRAAQRSIPTGGLCAPRLQASPFTAIAVFTLLRQTFRETACASDDGRISGGTSCNFKLGGPLSVAFASRWPVLVPVRSNQQNTVADVGDAVPVWHESTTQRAPRAVLPPGSPPFVRTEKERRA